MTAMPGTATHRYDPDSGMCLNLCTLPDGEALTVLDQLRCRFRRKLKPGYLARRRATECWLFDAATTVLGRPFNQPPAYFFLGDFSRGADHSRPGSLVVPLSQLPAGAMTFTMGDSMSARSNRRAGSTGSTRWLRSSSLTPLPENSACRISTDSRHSLLNCNCGIFRRSEQMSPRKAAANHDGRVDRAIGYRETRFFRTRRGFIPGGSPR
jgi:hypothetical protein